MLRTILLVTFPNLTHIITNTSASCAHTPTWRASSSSGLDYFNKLLLVVILKKNGFRWILKVDRVSRWKRRDFQKCWFCAGTTPFLIRMHIYTMIFKWMVHKTNVIFSVTCQCLTARHVLCFLGFLGMLAQYSQQNSFSVALVAMINSKSSSAVNMTSTSLENNTSLTEVSIQIVFMWRNQL